MENDFVKENRVIITVTGGPYDGVSIDSKSTNRNDHILATVFFRWAKEELVGKSFVTMSPGAIGSSEDELVKDGLLQNHKYTLASFDDVDGENYARFIYSGHTTREFFD